MDGRKWENSLNFRRHTRERENGRERERFDGDLGEEKEERERNVRKREGVIINTEKGENEKRGSVKMLGGSTAPSCY